MFKKLTVIVALVFCFCLKASAEIISNKYFSITMPDDIKGIYAVQKSNNSIDILEKISMKAGLIGYAFGLKIFKNPGDYVHYDGCKKIGELTDKNGVRYDMVLLRPTDVILSEGEEIQNNFNKLYEIGNNIEIKGINGSKYVKGKGMKGAELYGEILNKYKKAFTEKWNTAKQYEDASIDSVYYTLVQKNKDLLNKIGYAYYDINYDGIDELIIGEINKGKMKGSFYDLYTTVNRTPKIVLKGSDTNKYFVCYDSFVCIEEDSKNKKQNRLGVYGLDKNSTRRYPQFVFIYDVIANPKKPWFIKYIRFDDKGENVDKKEFNERKGLYINNYKRFDFIPFSQL